MENLPETSAHGHEMISKLDTITGLYNASAKGDFPSFLNAMVS